MEIWKDIIDYEGMYQVSSYGRIKSLSRIIVKNNGKKYNVKERILKGTIDSGGYATVNLHKEMKKTTYRIHNLVAAHFLLNPENKPYINHIDNDGSNNQIENLEWCTQKENMIHAVKSKRIPHGEIHYNCKFSQDIIIYALKLIKDGVRNKDICIMTGISRQHISNLKRNKYWKHLL